jgi:hypothetical protein
MSVTSEKVAEGLNHWEPSKDHDGLGPTTLPCVCVCVCVVCMRMMCLGCSREAVERRTLAQQGNE